MSDDRKHLEYMSFALVQARKCEVTLTAFCVGAIIVEDSTNTVIATGYSRELPGNTHAEQNCLTKLLSETTAARADTKYSLYTTMEPCSERLSGNIPCTDSIIRYNNSSERKERGLGRVEAVYVGVKEPGDFITNNVGQDKLLANGVGYIHISGLEEEILEVARKGHSNI
ncbi:cytidine deaminase-like protein [Terfezia claveryi]|nr:cytidine deaminase-like protein [Terfezia claveryi]